MACETVNFGPCVLNVLGSPGGSARRVARAIPINAHGPMCLRHVAEGRETNFVLHNFSRCRGVARILISTELEDLPRRQRSPKDEHVFQRTTDEFVVPKHIGPPDH